MNHPAGGKSRFAAPEVLVPIGSKTSFFKLSKQAAARVRRVEIGDGRALQLCHCRQDIGGIVARVTESNQAAIIGIMRIVPKQRP